MQSGVQIVGFGVSIVGFGVSIVGFGVLIVGFGVQFGLHPPGPQLMASGLHGVEL